MSLIDDAQNYWKYLPNGVGKSNSEELMLLSDQELIELWLKASTDRWQTYPEERDFVERFANSSITELKIFSIGPGLGFHETIYAMSGARLTVFDIVFSNLVLLKRLFMLLSLELDAVGHLYGNLPIFSGPPFDIFYFWGSLHHMAKDMQESWMLFAGSKLAPHGQIVIMSYTWKFVEIFCPGMTKETFDPVKFGAVSDPQVGKLVNPYSDWHDANKLQGLIEWAGHGPGAPSLFQLKETQEFNNGLYAWYVFEKII